MQDDDSRNHGPQPIEALMTSWALDNHQLVEHSVEQITHKQVQRARKGRQLTLHSMQKITRTLNEAVSALFPKELRVHFTPYQHRQLFNYAKGHDATWTDPNEPLKPQIAKP